jgi:hypothetical protein
LHENALSSAFYTWHRSEPDKTRGVYSRARIAPGPGNTFTLGDEIEIKSPTTSAAHTQTPTPTPSPSTNDGGVARTYLFSRGANFNPFTETRDAVGPWSPSRNFILNEPQRPT